MRRWLRLRLWRTVLPALMALLACLRPVAAEEVRREHLGLDLLANLELPMAGKLEGAPVVLIVHGTLAHHGVEFVKTLQTNLRERGQPSLALTLSLGRDARRGMFDCAVQHEHRLTDAADEIGAWVDWLKSRQVARIILLGHSRGAQQVAHYAVGEPDVLVDRLILVAPPVATAQDVADRYRAAFASDLEPLLARARQLAETGEEDTLLELPGFLHCKDARATAAALLDYYDPDDKHHVVALLRRISRPVLVIAGGEDRVAAAVPGRLKAADLGNHVAVRTIEGADHFFQDLFADDLAEQTKRFVDDPVRPAR